MKKIIVLFFGLFLSFSILSNTTLASESEYNIDFSKSGQGIVRILYKSEKDVKVKLMIIKDKEKYTYNIKSNEEYVNFPLQLGNGKYIVNIYENTTGKKYKQVFSNFANVNIIESNQVFVNSVQGIEWSNNNKAIKLASNIINDNIESSDRDKVTAIYQYIVKNITYDYNKAENLKYDYLPNIDNTLKSGTGICYDYASLLASMLRSASIPTKLVKGYSAHTDVYHAWNEIYIADENKWIVVDTTYDAYLNQNNKKYDLEKNESDYKKDKEY